MRQSAVCFHLHSLFSSNFQLFRFRHIKNETLRNDSYIASKLRSTPFFIPFFNWQFISNWLAFDRPCIDYKDRYVPCWATHQKRNMSKTKAKRHIYPSLNRNKNAASTQLPMSDKFICIVQCAKMHI